MVILFPLSIRKEERKEQIMMMKQLMLISLLMNAE